MALLTQKRYVRECLAVVKGREWANQYDLEPTAKKAASLTQAMTTLSLEAADRSRNLQKIVDVAVESFWADEGSGKADEAVQTTKDMLRSLERQREEMERAFNQTAYHLRDEESEEWTVFCEFKILVLQLVEGEIKDATSQMEYLEGYYTGQVAGETSTRMT